ncbi:hypothetical protein ASE61_06360 [Bosea sp. Root670]|uniref:hypothetical protein n=1 Tax=Bosea sp. Root670 TaxID=1736583 RepID=UPI00071243B0|nr:hypothetical protein [Bosea sp. Root670]KRE04555.1 hypothetical protein ASE61_06360 [Bosea sp. Root670]
MRIPALLLSSAVVAGLCCAALPAQARTEAMLQVNSDGRANAKRNRLVLTSKASGGRDVMVVISCRVDDMSTYGVALDFGAGAVWAVEGEDVTISRDGGEDIVQHMDSRDDYLTLGGSKAIGLFRQLLAGKSMAFAVKRKFTASFDLAQVERHVSRFRQLCNPR